MDKKDNIINFAELTREERVKHIDLSTSCVLKSSNTYYRREMAKFLNLETIPQGAICCHLCPNGSGMGNCSNPLHIYIGTPSENMKDRLALSPITIYHNGTIENCPKCNSTNVGKAGTRRNKPAFRCKDCKYQFVENALAAGNPKLEPCPPCPYCGSESRKLGMDRKGRQRYQCTNCRATDANNCRIFTLENYPLH